MILAFCFELNNNKCFYCANLDTNIIAWSPLEDEGKEDVSMAIHLSVTEGLFEAIWEDIEKEEDDDDDDDDEEEEEEEEGKDRFLDEEEEEGEEEEGFLSSI